MSEVARLKATLLAIGMGDFETMLQIVPEGIDHRGSAYKDARSFEIEGDYESDARYSYPAREKMVQAVVRSVLTEVQP